MTPETKARLARIRRVTFKLGWRQPFFLIPSQRLTFRIDDSIETACIDTRGTCRFNGAFLDGMDDDELTFVVAHELMHALMMHFGRQGTRVHDRWNRSCDRAINGALLRENIGKMPDGGLLPRDGEEEFTAEQGYDTEPARDSDGQGGKPPPGAGCGQEQAPGDDLSGDGEDPNGDGQAPSEAEASRSWREAAEQAKEVARGAGRGIGSLARVLTVPPSKVQWAALLRGACARAVATHGHDDVSFRKLNRRSHSTGFLLPGPVTYRALVAVVIDTSGSVPDEALERAVSETAAMSRVNPEVAIYLVTHDASVQWQGWIRAGAAGDVKIKSAIKERGGTLFDPPYRALEKAAPRFDAMVHLTDGMPCDGGWPTKPRNVRQGIAALIGCAQRQNVPDGWRTVEVEVRS